MAHNKSQKTVKMGSGNEYILTRFKMNGPKKIIMPEDLEMDISLEDLCTIAKELGTKAFLLSSTEGFDKKRKIIGLSKSSTSDELTYQIMFLNEWDIESVFKYQIISWKIEKVKLK